MPDGDNVHAISVTDPIIGIGTRSTPFQPHTTQSVHVWQESDPMLHDGILMRGI